MPTLLSIETATEVCSVGISLNGNMLAIREASGTNEHSALLTVFIGEILQEAKMEPRDIDAIAVSMGPGSYTGLRIGVSVAKGLCYALEKPLIAVGTLQAMALMALRSFGEEAEIAENMLICPMIDARRMEVYTALYNRKLEIIKPVEALILDENAFREYDGQVIAIIGNGAYKCAELFSGRSNIILPGIVTPSASAIAELAKEKFLKSEFENTAYFEPFYLKDFIAGAPRVKGLRD